MVDFEKLERIAINQIQKENDLADELVNMLLSHDLSDQERFNIVQLFKTKILGDIPLYS